MQKVVLLALYGSFRAKQTFLFVDFRNVDDVCQLSSAEGGLLAFHRLHSPSWFFPAFVFDGLGKNTYLCIVQERGRGPSPDGVACVAISIWVMARPSCGDARRGILQDMICIYNKE